jgi:hypothetical protein
MMVPWFPAAPFSGITGRLSDPKKSAFEPEGKMNKAGFCTAATKQNSKTANKDGLFRSRRSFTVLRFGAPGAGLQHARSAKGSIRTTPARAHAANRHRPQKRKTTGRALPVVSEV